MSTSRSGKHDFIPSREADLLNWSSNFRAKVNTPPGPGIYGLTPAQAAAYAAVHDAFTAAYATAVNPATNSKLNVEIKNTAKAALKDNARMLARLVRATPGVTSTQRSELGLNVPDASPTPVLTPQHSPLIQVVKVMGRTVRVRVSDSESLKRRGKPLGCAGAAVFTAMGDLPPGKLADWSFQANITRRLVDVHFDAQVPAGGKVWVMAFWYNPRGERGPQSMPVYTRIGDGVSFGQLALAA